MSEAYFLKSFQILHNCDTVCATLRPWLSPGSMVLQLPGLSLWLKEHPLEHHGNIPKSKLRYVVRNVQIVLRSKISKMHQSLMQCNTCQSGTVFHCKS